MIWLRMICYLLTFSCFVLHFVSCHPVTFKRMAVFKAFRLVIAKRGFGSNPPGLDRSSGLDVKAVEATQAPKLRRSEVDRYYTTWHKYLMYVRS